MKIRKNDKVEVMSGKKKDKGQRTEVLRVYKDTNKVLLKGINIATMHKKKTATNKGQILKIEKPIHVSSVMLVCPFTDKPTRIGYINIEEKGKMKKFRFSKIAVKNKGLTPEKSILK